MVSSLQFWIGLKVDERFLMWSRNNICRGIHTGNTRIGSLSMGVTLFITTWILQHARKLLFQRQTPRFYQHFLLKIFSITELHKRVRSICLQLRGEVVSCIGGLELDGSSTNRWLVVAYLRHWVIDVFPQVTE